eukprot:93956_1
MRIAQYLINKWFTKCVAVICGICIIKRLYLRLYYRYFNYPSCKLGLPICGCYFDLKKNGKKFLYSLGNNYGSIVMISMGIQSHIYINDSKVAQKLLKNSQLFNRPIFHNFDSNYFSFTFLSGTQWMKRRGFINKTFLKLAKSSIILQCTRRAMRKYVFCEIEEHIKNNKIWYPKSCVNYLSFNTIFYLLFGVEIEKNEGMYTSYIKIVSSKLEKA